MNDSFLFILGRTPELSATELFAIFPEQEKILCSRSVIEIHPVNEDPQEVLQLLGGVTKIAKKLDIQSEITPGSVATLLAQLPHKHSKISFAISALEGFFLPKKFLDDTKKELRNLGISSRFVEAKEGVLSSIVFEGQELIELIVFSVPGGVCIAQTVAVQDAQEWNDRDYGRPYADAKRGMLPLKVSRMIANIALGKNAKGKTLVDPFCGMGTVVGEAYLRGALTIGMDIDPIAIDKANKNMEWLTSRQKDEAIVPPRLLVGDAVHLSDIIMEKVDAIATEPYMGKTSVGLQREPNIELVKNTLKGLEKLYIGCLRDWSSVLNLNGIVVMAIPSYIINNHEYTVKTIIDSCEKFGYIIDVGPLTYSRPQAVVKRNFYIFRKITSS